MSKASLETEIRNNILNAIAEMLTTMYDTDVMPVSASELTIPVLDSEGNEKFALVKVSIPRGTRVNGGYEPYDGYAAAEDWKLVLADKADKAKARQEKAERAEKEKERKCNARKLVKDLNEKGLDALVHEDNTETEIENA